MSVAAVWAFVLLPALASAQGAPEEWLGRLQRVVPAADEFADRRGEPPVFEAYQIDAPTGQRTLIGYAFLTSDLPPEQKGFSGPIEVLVGMDLRGVLTGAVVTAYYESHRATRGDFLAAPGVLEQFTGKSIADAFRVRRDVDGISGATITVDAMSRGIRNAAREVAVAYRIGVLASAAEAPALDPVSVTPGELERLSWPQMVLRGLAQKITVLDDGETIANVTLTYVRDEGVAEVLMGPGLLAEALERAGPIASERHLVLAGVDGPAAGPLNLARLSIVQGADTVSLTTPDVLLFGPPREGKFNRQFRMLRVLLFDRAVDMTRPLTFVLDLRPGSGVFTVPYPGGQRIVDEQPIASSRSLPGWWAVTVAVLALLLFARVVLVTRRGWSRL